MKFDAQCTCLEEHIHPYLLEKGWGWRGKIQNSRLPLLKYFLFSLKDIVRKIEFVNVIMYTVFTLVTKWSFCNCLLLPFEEDYCR